MTTTHTVPYGFHGMTDLPFDDAVRRVRELLSGEGFGVLCEIDLAATMKAKLGKEMPAYVILGACNPPLAFAALTVDPGVGLLLPCNVIVRNEPGTSRVQVSAIDAERLLALTGNAALAPMAGEVAARLRRVIAEVSRSAARA
jgi:uncharacterized protein (DUF302 family)